MKISNSRYSYCGMMIFCIPFCWNVFLLYQGILHGGNQMTYGIAGLLPALILGFPWTSIIYFIVKNTPALQNFYCFQGLLLLCMLFNGFVTGTLFGNYRKTIINLFR